MKVRSEARFNRQQLMFKDIVLSSLIWACVLGFLGDYTEIAHAESFSYLFLAALVMAVLVYLTTMAKKSVLSRFDRQRSVLHKASVIFGTWLILFSSKFVFIGAIDLLFAGTVTIKGFLNIALVVITATVVQRVAEYTFVKLGNNRSVE